MLCRRIVPKLQLLRGRLVTTVQFDKRRAIMVGDPVSQARIFEAQGADELIALDIQPRGDGRATTRVLRRLSDELFLPLCAGGGVDSLARMRELFQAGADKVSVNTAALARPALLSEAAAIYGAQSVVLSIDYRVEGERRVVYGRGGAEPTGWDLLDWAERGVALGAGELLLCCINRDGQRGGLDLGAIREVTQAVGVPVVASGGCGLAEHFSAGFATGADAVAAGTYFCLQDQNITQVKAHIRNAGVRVRES